MANPLHHQIRSLDSLTEAEIGRMFQLMSAHYDCVNRQQFDDDLSWKNRVILLRDDATEIQGFSTLALNPKGTGGADFDVFYSGDTIIAREFWGSQELVRGFSLAAGQAFQPGRRLYWLLLSKGHRTYAYLPLFALRYFPAADPKRHAAELAPMADEAARKLFGDAWKPDLGVVRFSQSAGQLKRELIDGTRERATQRHVAYFLAKNPRFAEGDELVCMTELTPENLRRHVRQGFEEGAGLDLSAAA